MHFEANQIVVLSEKKNTFIISRNFRDVFETFSRSFQDDFETFSRRFQDVFKSAIPL